MTRTIEVSEETYERIKNQLSEDEAVDVNSYADFVGKSLFIRTVTYHYTGIVKKVFGKLIELESAAWQAYQPRLKNFLFDGDVDEVEPIGQCWINIDSIVDIMPYKHKHKMEQK